MIDRGAPQAHQTQCLWNETTRFSRYPVLARNLKCDVCVVGGGIAGLTSAYMLMKEGKQVCLLESKTLGSGQSGQTTAHFSSVLESRYFDLEDRYGSKDTHRIAQSLEAAINRVEEIIDSEGIFCDYKRVDGYLFTSPDESLDLIWKELQAVHRAGLFEVHATPRAPIKYFDTDLCLRFPRQVQLNPVKYMSGLAEALIAGGGLIFENTHVLEMEGGDGAFVKTREGFQVHAHSIVVATNTPVNNVVSIHSKQAAYRTYVVGFKIPKGSVPEALYWDTEKPYHYLRIYPWGDRSDVLLVGGEDHKTGQNKHPEENFERLKKWTRHRFVFAREVIFEWSGQVMASLDGLAYLGRNPYDETNVYIITGDSGNGMTFCTLGGMIICDQILGRDNPWVSLYDPSRLSLHSAADFLSENLNVALQYTDWLNVRDEFSVETLPRGEGMIVHQGLKKIAAYRAENGRLYQCSAVCPHLGGIVRWNTVEKSWDCPCHGSRFDCRGHLIEGPALSDLRPLNERAHLIASF